MESLEALVVELAATRDPEVRMSLAPAIAELQRRVPAAEPEEQAEVIRSRVAHLRRIGASAAMGMRLSSSVDAGPDERPFDSIGAPADGFVPPRSNTKGVPRFTWDAHRGGDEWLQYEFPEPRMISGAATFWYYGSDGSGSTDLPQSWRIHYRDAAGDWQPVQALSGYGVRAHQLNEVLFEPVETRAVRLGVSLREDQGVGLFHFQVSE